MSKNSYSRVGGENAELLRAIINDTPYTGEITSRNSAILDSIIKGSAYTDPPQSEIEALLLDLKEKIEGGGSIEVEELNVTENGTYTADIGKAFNPVNVDIASPVLITKNITANGDYSASADNADGYSSVSVNVPLPSNAYLLKSIEHESIATFADGTDNFLKSLEVAIAPQQDLHGYDSPWVGGAGKNKLKMSDKTFSGADVYYSDWSYNFGIDNAAELQAGVTYTLSFDITCNNMPCYVSVGIGNGYYSLDVGQVEITENGRVHITFTPANDSLQYGNIFAFRAPRYNSLATYSATLKNIMLEVGSSPTAFAPYSNICPIIGWDECKVTVADDTTSPTTENVYTIDLDGTRYGGKLDVINGVLTVTDGFISSYNGETLPSTWISDRDVYAEGTTPTIGAEVCYKLATPQTIQLPPTIIKSLQGENNLLASTGEIEILQYWGKEQN